MTSIFRFFLPLALAVPLGVAAGTGGETSSTQSDKRTDLVDCRDYRGALRRVGDRCERPMGVRRVYSADELLATGHMTTGEALRQLDPSFR